MRRETLPSGEWMDLTERLNHAQTRRIRAARGTPEVAAVGLAAMARGWLVRDSDGREVPCPPPAVDGVPESALDAFPEDTFAEFAERAVSLLEAQPDPKGSAGTPTSTPQGQP